ncbi:MAG: NUDIX domain-containing protein, partial [Alphaproteobacteria bacterium]|nr:NUDIX domain-containing protein [Alphaproteobacteria bacterium]
PFQQELFSLCEEHGAPLSEQHISGSDRNIIWGKWGESRPFKAIPCAVAVTLTELNGELHFVFIQRGKNTRFGSTPTFPGGKRDAKTPPETIETIEEASRREFEEETGIAERNLRKLGELGGYMNPSGHYSSTVLYWLSGVDLPAQSQRIRKEAVAAYAADARVHHEVDRLFTVPVRYFFNPALWADDYVHIIEFEETQKTGMPAHRERIFRVPIPLIDADGTSAEILPQGEEGARQPVEYITLGGWPGECILHLISRFHNPRELHQVVDYATSAHTCGEELEMLAVGLQMPAVELESKLPQYVKDPVDWYVRTLKHVFGERYTVEEARTQLAANQEEATQLAAQGVVTDALPMNERMEAIIASRVPAALDYRKIAESVDEGVREFWKSLTREQRVELANSMNILSATFDMPGWKEDLQPVERYRQALSQLSAAVGAHSVDAATPMRDIIGSLDVYQEALSITVQTPAAEASTAFLKHFAPHLLSGGKTMKLMASRTAEGAEPNNGPFAGM